MNLYMKHGPADEVGSMSRNVVDKVSALLGLKQRASPQHVTRNGAWLGIFAQVVQMRGQLATSTYYTEFFSSSWIGSASSGGCFDDVRHTASYGF